MCMAVRGLRTGAPRSREVVDLDMRQIERHRDVAEPAVDADRGLHALHPVDLPHVQIYNFPTSWRTGPQAAHGHAHQVSVEGRPTPSFDAVWQAWRRVRPVAFA